MNEILISWLLFGPVLKLLVAGAAKQVSLYSFPYSICFFVISNTDSQRARRSSGISVVMTRRNDAYRVQKQMHVDYDLPMDFLIGKTTFIRYKKTMHHSPTCNVC